MSVVSSPLAGRQASWAFLYAAIVLTAAAALIIEISFTRIFSVVFYYHFAFLAVSVALFGLGAGGVLAYGFAGRGTALYPRLGQLSLANALAVAGALAVAVRAGGWPAGFFTYAAVYFVTAVPFVFSGIVLSLVIAETVERVDRVYFFDLLGAAAGCLLVIPFLNLMGGPGAILGAAVLLAAASAVWFGLSGAWAGRAAATAVALALVGLIVANRSLRLVDVTAAKGRDLGQERFVQWNSFSRVSLIEDGSGGPLILIDADSSSRIPPFDPTDLSQEERERLLLQGPGYAFRLRPGGRTLIIGAGGGWDVARALASGSKDVTAVEINPIIIDTIMRGRFRGLSRGLFLRPEVRVVVEDGRSFLRRATGRYDLIVATLVDTRASTAAGAYALSENSVYTVEAFLDCLERLKPAGLLSFTRWGLDPPRESLRLAALARRALELSGRKEPWRHIVVLREQNDAAGHAAAMDTVLVSREPFPVEELEHAALEAARAQLEIVYMPGQAAGGPFAELLASADPRPLFDAYPYDVRPVSDDRPFFFFFSRLDRLFAAPQPGDPSAPAARTLFALLAVSLLAVAVMLALPPLVLRAKLERAPGLRLFLLYFVFLGAGYVLVQVGLIQRLVFLLGHPTYALTVVIFAMLLFSGLGSFSSRRLIGGEDGRLMRALAAAAALIAAAAFLAGPFIHAGARWTLPVKMLATALFIALPAFAMGMAFPSGLLRLSRWQPSAVKWAWSVNAAASVLGSCAAVFLSISAGLRHTLLAGALMYAAALAVLAAVRRGAASAR
ncbi:MAG: hypothetical protein N2036_04610 [Bryobacteraceae bacterium]|nr:hypothetical protein [Bryobacteraceae bacterium]